MNNSTMRFIIAIGQLLDDGVQTPYTSDQVLRVMGFKNTTDAYKRGNLMLGFVLGELVSNKLATVKWYGNKSYAYIWPLTDNIDELFAVKDLITKGELNIDDIRMERILAESRLENTKKELEEYKDFPDHLDVKYLNTLLETEEEYLKQTNKLLGRLGMNE